MSYFSSNWKPVNPYCSAPGALSGAVNRNGMGDLGNLPVELVIEIFKHIPFRDRLRAAIFVSKSFQGLMLEKVLWKDIEVSRCLVAPTLANMIRPTDGSEPLLPGGSINELIADMEYCTTGSVIGLIKRLHTQSHTPNTLSFTGNWCSLFSLMSYLSKAIYRSHLNLSGITTCSLTGDPIVLNRPYYDNFNSFLAAMPNLLHLSVVETRQLTSRKIVLHNTSVMAAAHPCIRTFNIPSLPIWLWELHFLAESLPALEKAQFCVVGSEDLLSPLPFPNLREATISYHEAALDRLSGESRAEYVVGLLESSPGLKILNWIDESGSCICKEVRERWGQVRMGAKVNLLKRTARRGGSTQEFCCVGERFS